MADYSFDKVYSSIVDKYLNNDSVSSLKEIPHHNSNRLNHCLKVSYLSYKITKKMNLDYESAAIGGLLHDLYFDRVADKETKKEKIKLFTGGHPKDALKNATDLFELNELEKDIIVSHMWPLSLKVPKHRESFIVSMVDKAVSTKEFSNKFHMYASNTFGIYFLLLINLIFK